MTSWPRPDGWLPYADEARRDSSCLQRVGARLPAGLFPLLVAAIPVAEDVVEPEVSFALRQCPRVEHDRGDVVAQRGPLLGIPERRQRSLLSVERLHPLLLLAQLAAGVELITGEMSPVLPFDGFLQVFERRAKLFPVRLHRDCLAQADDLAETDLIRHDEQISFERVVVLRQTLDLNDERPLVGLRDLHVAQLAELAGSHPHAEPERAARLVLLRQGGGGQERKARDGERPGGKG